MQLDLPRRDSHWGSFLGNHEKITINGSPAFIRLYFLAFFTHFEP
jgi:hypothetical protein